jgi:hypothetical protein
MPLLLETMEDARLIKAMLKQQGKSELDVAALLQDMARVCELGGRHSSAAALRQVADEPWDNIGAVGFFSPGRRGERRGPLNPVATAC